MKKLLLGVFCTAALAFPAEFISFGVKGGVPLNDAFKSASTGQIQYITHNRRYTVGPELDINLPFGLGVEVDALYRRLAFDTNTNNVDQFVRSATTANAWDFPLLLKWRFLPGPVRPYLSVGPTFRGLTNIHERVENFFAPGSTGSTTSTSSPATLSDRFTTGFTVGGGLQIGGAGIRLSPEIRYTRWGWATFKNVGSAFQSNPDQLDFLIGLTF